MKIFSLHWRITGELTKKWAKVQDKTGNEIELKLISQKKENIIDHRRNKNFDTTYDSLYSYDDVIIVQIKGGDKYRASNNRYGDDPSDTQMFEDYFDFKII